MSSSDLGHLDICTLHKPPTHMNRNNQQINMLISINSFIFITQRNLSPQNWSVTVSSQWCRANIPASNRKQWSIQYSSGSSITFSGLCYKWQSPQYTEDNSRWISLVDACPFAQNKLQFAT